MYFFLSVLQETQRQIESLIQFCLEILYICAEINICMCANDYEEDEEKKKTLEFYK